MPATTSCSATPRVAALLSDQGRLARARSAFGDAVRFCDSPAQLLALGRSNGVELVVVAPRGANDRPALTTTVAAIRASRHSPPIYVYGDRSIECARQLMPLARAGARGLILLDVDDDVASLRRLLTRGRVADAIETLSMVVQQVVSTRHLPLFLFCVEHIAAPPPAEAFARHLKVSRRTLSAWAQQAGARGVRSMTSKCRVLAALEMIRGADRSVEQVALELRFASSAHLHNTIRRYTGRKPREAAREDLVLWCRRLFTTASPPAGENGPPPAEWPMTPNDTILPPTHQGSP